MIVHILVAWTCLSVLVAALWALHAHRETKRAEQRRDRAANEFHSTGRREP